jgi:uncharacterized protein DUF3303
MQYMVIWSTMDPKASIKQFLESEIAFPGVTIRESLHVVGEGSGFVLLEAPDPMAVHAAMASWSDLLDIQCYAVISDAEARQALKG